jgi:hypothetical protein
MNRYSDFQPNSNRRTSSRSLPASLIPTYIGGDYYNEQQVPLLRRRDYERQPKHVRSLNRAAAVVHGDVHVHVDVDVQPLYPSTRNMPDIPLAAVVFNKTKTLKHVHEHEHEHEHVPPSSYDGNSTPEYKRHESYQSQSPSLSPSLSSSSSVYENNHRSHNSHHSPQPQHQHLNPVEDDETIPNPNFERPLVEVAPGQWVELRGSEETWHAVQRNYTRKVECFSCTIQMHAIQDAALVLCPECRMIVPFNDDGEGLGLGVRVHHDIDRLPTTNNTTLVKEELSPTTTITNIYQMKDPPTEKATKVQHHSNKASHNDAVNASSHHSIQKVRAPTTRLGQQLNISPEP